MMSFPYSISTRRPRSEKASRRQASSSSLVRGYTNGRETAPTFARCGQGSTPPGVGHKRTIFSFVPGPPGNVDKHGDQPAQWPSMLQHCPKRQEETVLTKT